MGGSSRFALAKLASRCIRAKESPPPETATTMGPSSGFMAAAKSSASLLAAGRLAETDGGGEGLRRGVGVFLLDEAKRGAAFRFLAHAHEGLCQLQHSVGRAR